MTVSSAIATATLNWTGVETSFTPGFQAQNPGDVSVVFTSTAVPPLPTQTLTYNTHYGVSLDVSGNVTVTPISLPLAPGTLTIARNSTPLQQSFFQDGIPWSAAVIMAALDLCALRDQELRRDVGILPTSLAAEILRAEAAEASLWAAITPMLALITTALQSWLTGSITPLPTTPPAAAGAFWNDGGVLCVTPGGPNPLPTTLPTTVGLWWNNGGVVCISQ